MNSWASRPTPKPLEERLALAHCDESPTQAHHWKVELEGFGNVRETCKHCGVIREHMEMSWPERRVIEEPVIALIIPAGFHVEET